MRLSMKRLGRCLSYSGLILLAGCTTSRPGLAPNATFASAAPTHTTLQQLVERDLKIDDALLIGAGDIADCNGRTLHAQATAAIIKKFPGAKVFTAGDNAYRNGTTDEFNDCYSRSWGTFKERTWPSPGNHDYGIYEPALRFDAEPYFKYFGADAKPAGLGYYSHDLGGWHIVSLDSMAGKRGAPTMADQVEWLEGDLARNEKRCILAFWHHPLYSSGEHGDDTRDPGRSMTPLWDVLLKYKADVIINGHDHHYERFALQDQRKKATSSGIRQFVVGTGGGEDRGLGTIKPNSEVQLPHVYGVLLMTLHPGGYEWHFINTNGNVDDQSQGIDECH